MALQQVIHRDGLTLKHDPNASEIYRWTWTGWLDGETISGTPVIVAESGITAALVATGTTYVDVRISGGAAGLTYGVTVRVTSTPNARIQDRTVKFSVRER